MPTTISVSDILQELSQAASRTDTAEGFATIGELCGVTGWGAAKVRKALKLAQAEGQLQVRKVNRPTLSGTLHPVPVYRVSPKAKGKRG